MVPYADSTDHGTADYVLFAVGFLGFLIAASGMTVSSPPVAIAGAVILLLVVSWFARQSSDVE
jgi:hypothetical protein